MAYSKPGGVKNPSLASAVSIFTANMSKDMSPKSRMGKCRELQNMSFLWSFHLDALRYLLPEAFSFMLIALRVHRHWPLQITGDISTFLSLKRCWLIFISPVVSNKLIPQALMHHIYVAHDHMCIKFVMCACEVTRNKLAGANMNSMCLTALGSGQVQGY